MADQSTTADQQATDESPPATDQPNAAERPMGTRELRDAQASSERAAAETPASRTSEPRIPRQRPAIRATDGGAATSGGAATEAPKNAPLFDAQAGKELRERWLVVQTEFVDEPRVAVQKADALVAEVLKQLTDTFAREREELEAGWSGSGSGSADRSEQGSEREISTEDLRQAIQRYRSFFNRLLAL